MTTLGSMALRPYLRLFAVSTNHRFVISSLVYQRFAPSIADVCWSAAERLSKGRVSRQGDAFFRCAPTIRHSRIPGTSRCLYPGMFNRSELCMHFHMYARIFLEIFLFLSKCHILLSEGRKPLMSCIACLVMSRQIVVPLLWGTFSRSRMP